MWCCMGDRYGCGLLWLGVTCFTLGYSVCFLNKPHHTRLPCSTTCRGKQTGRATCTAQLPCHLPYKSDPPKLQHCWIVILAAGLMYLCPKKTLWVTSFSDDPLPQLLMNLASSLQSSSNWCLLSSSSFENESSRCPDEPPHSVEGIQSYDRCGLKINVFILMINDKRKNLANGWYA